MFGSKTWRGAVLAALIGAGVASQSFAQPTTTPPRPDKTTKVRPEMQMGQSEILQKIASDDAAVRHSVIEYFKDRLNSQPSRVIELRSQVFKALLTNKHYDEALDLANYAIFAVPHDARSVETFQQAKVKSLLAAGKTEEALSNAKSLFNVATMAGTSEAILLVAECLNAARPKDKDIFNKFREEQMAGAAPQSLETPAAVNGAKGPRCTVLDSIKVDAKAYDEALAKLTAEDYQGLMARGNLLLMADRVKEAREVFERMYSLSGSSELVDSSEALARTIRAEDGTIGRANAWVQAIKPRKDAAPAPVPSTSTNTPAKQ